MEMQMERKRDERGEAWAVPRKWRQYLLKDAPIYILRSCWLAECEGRTQRPESPWQQAPIPTSLHSFATCPAQHLGRHKRHTQVTARAVDKKWNYVDKKCSMRSSRAERGWKWERGVWGTRKRQNVGCQLAVCQLGGLRRRAWVMVLPASPADALPAS